MGQRPTIKPVEYWLAKDTKQVLLISGSARHSDLWHASYMRLRFFHHPESDSVLYEDWYLLEEDMASRPSVLHSGMVEEITYEEYLWLKTLYDNPEL